MVQSQNREFVSLCATVFNESESIQPWLESIWSQTRRPDEVVICDGGSTDGTVEILLREADQNSLLKVIACEEANVPEGRNLAMAEAKGSILAVTDAGTILNENWLKAIVEPLESDSSTDVVSGFFEPAGRNRFERVLAAATTPILDEMPDDGFPPSSRSLALRKEWWSKVGGYPEWLRGGEDLLFVYDLRDAGAKFTFAPDAVVSWYPRPKLRAFYDQYRHYGRGDGHAHMRVKKHLARYSGWTIGLILLAFTPRYKVARPLFLAGAGYHMRLQAKRVFRNTPYRGLLGMAYSMALVPVIVVVGDIGRMLGFARGIKERLAAGDPKNLAKVQIESHRDENLIRDFKEKI